MKKISILVLSLASIIYLSNAAFSQSAFAIKAGIDLMGKSELNSDDVDLDPGDVDNGFGIGAEMMISVNEQFIIGGGVVYQLSRAINETGWSDTEFNYVPIYGLAKYFFQPKGTKPYVAANIGYGLLFGDMESLETYTASLPYDEYLKHFFLNLIVTLGKDAVVGKTLIYNPNALDGVIVRLV